MKNSPIGCRFTRKIPSLGDEKFLLGHNPVTENSSDPPPEYDTLIKVVLININLASTHFDQNPSFSISEFSFLHYTPNRKLGDGKPRSLIKRPLRKLRGFHLGVFRFECGAKRKTRSWKTSEFDQSTSKFGYSAKWKTRSGKTSEKYSTSPSALVQVKIAKPKEFRHSMAMLVLAKTLGPGQSSTAADILSFNFIYSQAAQKYTFMSTSGYCGSYTCSTVQLSPATAQENVNSKLMHVCFFRGHSYLT